MNTLSIKFNNAVTVTKTKGEWIDELTNYHLDLAYDDGEFGNGLLDDFLRCGFKGFNNMTDKELISEVLKQLSHLYDESEVN